MKCPICKDVTLLMSEKKGIEIDYCPECRGIWLDRGELEKLIEKETAYNDNYYQESKNQENLKEITEEIMKKMNIIMINIIQNIIREKKNHF